MKVNNNYILKDFAGDHVLVRQDKDSIDFTKVITLNEIGVLIYQGIKDNKSIDDIVGDILNEYDVSEDIARKDITEYIKKLIEMDIVHE